MNIHHARLPYLESGEEVERWIYPVFPYNQGNPVVAVAMLNADKRAIVVTNRRFIVLRTAQTVMGGSKQGLPLAVEYAAPRSTHLGEPRGLFWRCDALGKPLWIHRRSGRLNVHDYIRALNALIEGRAT